MGGGGGALCRVIWCLNDGSLWRCLIFFFSFFFHLQDLKEKKLAEEKENGKDAATNGKVNGVQKETNVYIQPAPL